MTRIVTEAELRAAIGYDVAALRQVEQGYRWLQEREISMPPVFHIDIDPQSAVDIKGAYVEGLDAFAIKMASGFYGNADKGIPSSSSVILVISAKTGFCEAVFLDNGYLMNLRTALAGAVAADHLAKQKTTTVGIVGTGVQARAQLQALTLVRNFDRVLVWGRDMDKSRQCAVDMRQFTKAQVTHHESLPDLASQSDILVTTTQTSTPLILPEWIRPGTHITAMGSDLPGKQELTSEVLQKADLIVCDSIPQCLIGGELQHVQQETLRQAPVELSAVICGQDVGRKSDEDITICDMTGLGVLDTAISLAALPRV